MTVINKCLKCELITINDHAGASTVCQYCHNIYLIWLNYEQCANEYHKNHKCGLAFGGQINKKQL